MIHRWKFTDLTGERSPWVFRRNPHGMTSPYKARQFSAEHTSSGLSGRPLVWEGPAQLTDMSFEGTLISESDWTDFLDWVYETRGNVLIEDHLGRQMEVVFRKFDPVLEAGIRVVNGRKEKFYGKYTITCLVLNVREGFNA